MNRLNILPLICAALMLVSCNKEETVILTGLEINPRLLNMVDGESAGLELIFTPTEFADRTASWESSDERVVTVDQEGIVTAQSPGTAVITVIASGVMAVCDVNVVRQSPSGIELDTASLSLYTGESYTLRVSAIPEDADLSALSWTSSASQVATVNTDGTVTAVADGSAVITASIGDVKADCEVRVATKAQPGDFYYSDGTWSTDLDESKTVVGVVFWSGDATSEDKILAAEHPECVHGLAVSLTEEESEWQSLVTGVTQFKSVSEWGSVNMPDYEELQTGMARGENGNYRLGYNNTEILLAFNEAPENAEWQVHPAAMLLEYREQHPLPETTSGWYMPSIKELFILSAGDTDDNIFWLGRTLVNEEIVNASLSRIEGSHLLGEKTRGCWSSTEQDNESKVYVLDFTIETTVSRMFKYSVNTNRFIFAF
ncbi:MAG TPA: Ig-like domain-containing protein [Candidatus Coprenecus stercoravium]|uniref:Ig-like domain-containing protein n=1 Tax=Candidatus Coprenecus stercoravium TaxID=2840735 RepID=A0A9D2GQ54_9BACT|nr:Ig-like domain-containing protein [Candidatus Coprenecus stercoravium]